MSVRAERRPKRGKGLDTAFFMAAAASPEQFPAAAVLLDFPYSRVRSSGLALDALATAWGRSLESTPSLRPVFGSDRSESGSVSESVSVRGEIRSRSRCRYRFRPVVDPPRDISEKIEDLSLLEAQRAGPQVNGMINPNTP